MKGKPMNYTIRRMTLADYEPVVALWHALPGIGLVSSISGTEVTYSDGGGGGSAGDTSVGGSGGGAGGFCVGIMHILSATSITVTVGVHGYGVHAQVNASATELTCARGADLHNSVLDLQLVTCSHVAK